MAGRAVLELHRAMLCRYCKHGTCLSKIIDAQGLAGLRRNKSMELHTARAYSVFSRHAAPAAAFSGSLHITNPHRSKSRPQHAALPNCLLGGALLLLSPCGVGLPAGLVLPHRAYSISPHPQQKQEVPENREVGRDSEKATPTQLRSDRSSVEAKAGDEEEAPKELSLMGRFKDAYKNYGKVLVVVHCLTSAVWFSTFYYAAYAGIDVVPLLKWAGVSGRFITPFQSSGVGDVAVAYLLYKLATPARYPVTIVGTRYTVKYLRSIGVMQPVPKGARIRDFVKESKVQVREKYEDLKEKGEELKDKMEEKRDDIKEKIDDKRAELKEKKPFQGKSRFKKPR